MASISTRSNGGREIQFTDGNGKRRVARLGKVPMKFANEVKLRVEFLDMARRTGQPIDSETAGWVRRIGDLLHAKLAAIDLVDPRGRSNSITIETYWAEFVAGKKKLKPRTLDVLKFAGARAVKFFTAAKPVSAVTAGDAERFADWLRGEKGFAEATAARTLRWARTVFARATKDRLIPFNPFDDLKPGSMANPSRLRYVSIEDTLRVMNSTPDPEWKVVIALARFAGLRIPSELIGLTWADVNIETRRMVVRSPKLEHTKRGVRIVPIFPELLPHLQAMFAAAPVGESLVCPTISRSQGLRGKMRRLIERAGLVPWDSVFQNLRASFDIDLHEQFPAHVAADWVGHTEKTARGHYLKVQEEHFAKATGGAPQKAPQHPPARGRTEAQSPAGPAPESSGLRPSAPRCGSVPAVEFVSP
jgi:integrase